LIRIGRMDGKVDIDDDKDKRWRYGDKR
jgi:hypothetical protein